MNPNEHYLANERLIDREVWKTIRRYRLYPPKFYLKLKDVGNEVYCITKNKYKKELGFCFSTYLCSNLQYAMLDYIKNNLNTYKEISIDPGKFDRFIFHQTHEEIQKELLSDDSKKIINYILSREWEDPEGRQKLPRYSSVLNYFMKMYNWNRHRIEKSWNEIKHWWNGELKDEVMYA